MYKNLFFDIQIHAVLDKKHPDTTEESLETAYGKQHSHIQRTGHCLLEKQLSTRCKNVSA
jgi:hypothetical protein